MAAGLIRELNADAFKRGEAIYGYLCVNCHGTKDQPGSLPTSLRFASGTFKNGCEPYRMYQTLTQGYGMMMPQTWMVPQQKYDVIHYLREAYLKPYNPTQYAAVNPEYLAQLPPGAGRGPPPENLEPWVTMDYGPHLTATYEVGSDQTNFAYKGIAVRLDPGPGGVSRGADTAAAFAVNEPGRNIHVPGGIKPGDSKASPRRTDWAAIAFPACISMGVAPCGLAPVAGDWPDSRRGPRSSTNGDTMRWTWATSTVSDS